MNKQVAYQDILSELAPYLMRVEESLADNLNTRVELIETINRYIAASGGKRLRPILMIIAARLSGYKDDRFTGLATVIEYLHSATLLHDDVLDGAVVRRGNTSANIKWGNAATVLSGDFLFSRAFSILVEGYSREITTLMCGTAIKMIEGEVRQLSRKNQLGIASDEYYHIIGLKTASLISSSCQAGAMLGGARAEIVELLGRFGYELGLAFQIVDDTLDFVADPKRFGKAPANDFREGTITLPVIKLLENLDGPRKDRVEALILQEEIGQEDTSWIISLIKETGSDRQAYKEADRFVGQALSYLRNFDDGPYKRMFEAAAEYVISRQV